MDHFLQAYELKSLVCAELTGDKKDLYALARTCRAFLDPSLDHLWRTIDSFKPLLGCLPTDAWREEVQMSMFTEKQAIVFPSRAITAEDLERYHSHYARRIRGFYYWTKGNMKILSVEMLSSLQAVSGGEYGALTPLLKSFAWEAEVLHHNQVFLRTEQDQVPFVLSLFVGDTVTQFDFTVSVEANIPPIRMALNRLSGLRSLKLGKVDGFISQEEIITACDSWADLTSLSLNGGLSFSVPALASLPRLSRLQLYNVQEPGMLDLADEIAANGASFKALEQLHVKGLRLEDAAAYFRFIPPSNGIHTVKCCSSDFTSAEECYATIHILQQHLNPLVLKNLEIRDLQLVTAPHFLDLYEDPLGPEPVPGFSISPLFKFTKLKTLAVCSASRAMVTEADVALIVKTWPHIQELDLCGSGPDVRTPSIDYGHLLRIADGCKALRALGVPFDGTRLSRLPENSIRSHSVEVLRVCGSTIRSDDQSVDVILRSNFPQLRLLDTSYQPWLTVDGPNEDSWAGVAERLRADIE